MGFLLDRNQVADWTKDPVVPVPAEPVKAAAQPGAVREGFQSLYSRIFGVLRGEVSVKSVLISAAKAAGAPVFPSGGLTVEFDLARFISLAFEFGGEPVLAIFSGAKNAQLTSTRLRIVSGASTASVEPDRVRLLAPPLPVNTALAHTLVSEVFPRAWGIVYIEGGAFIADYPDGIGFGVAIVTDPSDGANSVVRVTLAQAMATTRYHVHIQALFNGAFVDATSIMVVREIISARTTTQIYLKAYASAAAGAAAINCASAKLGFSFHVFGRQA